MSCLAHRHPPEDHFADLHEWPATCPPLGPADGSTGVKELLPTTPTVYPQRAVDSALPPGHTPSRSGSLTESGDKMEHHPCRRAQRSRQCPGSVDHKLVGTHALPNPEQSVVLQCKMWW
jgi:hypothetical protein